MDTGLDENDAVSGSDGQTVDNRARCDEAIFDWHGIPGFAKTRQQFRPFQAGVRIPGGDSGDAPACIEPAFERDPLLGSAT